MREMSVEDIQSVSLDILKDIHSFCVEHHIKYTLYGGTMIGAIRHHGFIPWDDDVDIAMPRPDYERFLKQYKSKKFRLFKGGDKNCYLAFSRVCEMEKTRVDNIVMPWTNEKTGIWIDIFPIDGAFDHKYIMKIQFKISTLLWYVCCCARASFSPMSIYPQKEKKIKLLLKKILLNNAIFNVHALTKVYIAFCKYVKWGSTKHVANLAYMGYGQKEYQDIVDFDGYIEVPFAGENFIIVRGYDHLMRSKYGDYMKMPPESKRISNHALVSYYFV